MEVHPLANIFPPMTDDERGELFNHMGRYGQIHPIITYEGMILDGRNRHHVCCILELTPKYQEWSGEGETPLAYVVGCNLQRRNLTPSQRAAIALDVKVRLSEEYRERQVASLKKGKEKPEARFRNNSETGKDAQRDAAAMMQVNPHYVSDAERIREVSPRVFDAVKDGRASIPEAKRIIAAPPIREAFEAGSLGVEEAKARAREATKEAKPDPAIPPETDAQSSPDQAATDDLAIIAGMKAYIEREACRLVSPERRAACRQVAELLEAMT